MATDSCPWRANPVGVVLAWSIGFYPISSPIMVLYRHCPCLAAMLNGGQALTDNINPSYAVECRVPEVRHIIEPGYCCIGDWLYYTFGKPVFRGLTRIPVYKPIAHVYSLMTETKEIDLTKTVKLPLATSNRKNERIQQAIDEWQEVAKFYADRLQSFEDWKWGNHNRDGTGVFYKPIKEGEFSEMSLYADDMHEACKKVSEAYTSWRGNGKPSNNHPKGEFGYGNYFRTKGKNINIAKSDGIIGICLKLEPHADDEWFRVKGGGWEKKHLEGVLDGEWRAGTAEFHLTNGSLKAHLSISKTVEGYKPGTTDTVVGVDIGENVLHRAVAVKDGEVLETDTPRVSGAEFRHYRDKISDKMSEVSGKGDLRRLKRELSGQRERYTKKVLEDSASSIVELADRHKPCYIAIEELTGLRRQVKEPIHDWPYAKHQEKIITAAKKKSIAVDDVDPSGTSTTCKKCGYRDQGNRDGISFHCLNCGYQNHADWVAAYNIASDEQPDFTASEDGFMELRSW